MLLKPAPSGRVIGNHFRYGMHKAIFVHLCFIARQPYGVEWIRRSCHGLGGLFPASKFTTEALVRFQVSPGGVYGGQRENGQVFLRIFSFTLSLSFPQRSLSHLISNSIIFNSPYSKQFLLLAIYFYCTWGIDKYTASVFNTCTVYFFYYFVNQPKKAQLQ